MGIKLILENIKTTEEGKDYQLVGEKEGEKIAVREEGKDNEAVEGGEEWKGKKKDKNGRK